MNKLKGVIPPMITPFDEQGNLDDLDDYGDTYEPEDPSELAGFYDLDEGQLPAVLRGVLHR